MSQRQVSSPHRSTPDPGLGRRDFLKLAGAGLAAGPILTYAAGPLAGSDVPDHCVPRDKKLNAAWVRELFARGERSWYAGADLDTIGMPAGGVGAGQVYLTGDGRLTYWDIFNTNHNTGYGRGLYQPGRKPSQWAEGGRFRSGPEIAQGAALRVRIGERTLERRLNGEDFPKLRFAGEYPLGIVEYRDPDFPLAIRLEAGSPFIPLNAEDSALPATVFTYTLRNRTGRPAEVTLAGWLENAAGILNRERIQDRVHRVNRVLREEGLAAVLGQLESRAAPPASAVRPPRVLADFEADGYAGWQIEGEAFGRQPARGAFPGQQPVSGYAGERLVNTFHDGSDRSQGRLISPTFTLDRRYLSLLVGGGRHPERTCVKLLVDERVVLSATGRDAERLRAVNWDVSRWQGRSARLEIVDRESGPWGHVNVDQIELRDEPRPRFDGEVRDLPDYGSLCLAVVKQAEATVQATAAASPDRLWQDLAGAASDRVARRLDQPLIGAAQTAFTLAPGQTRQVTLVVTWFMPNQYRGRAWDQDDGSPRVGHDYARRFHDAADVARYVATHGERLWGRTRLWHATVYDTTLPHWLMDRIGATVCNLATNTCQWWRNGRFWAWEGVGCCHGTCGHVWNYAQALARLFPRLERSVRLMQDFMPGAGFDPETGAIAFRGENWTRWAGDSQGGTILKAYREHQCAPNNEFLRAAWPRIKQATEFLIGQDGNDDGLLEGRQHQTYDQDYYGPNTFVGSLYLGALRAAEEMAGEVGDRAFAARCRRIFEAGRSHSVQRLFNGEYYVQKVDLKKHPEWQYADGCLADQMFGQGWAHQVGLGYLYPPETVKKSLQAIWDYCWTPDVAAQNRLHKPERWFALPGEGGLFTCTWPRSRHLGPKSTRYRNEVWTGIEYQVASHMAWEGMLTEALAICRTIHDRYHPAKRNPFNEIECGDHYARSLASWGVLTGLAGFAYHGPRQTLALAPRITPEDFRCVFTAAEGWGSLSQTRDADRQVDTVHVRWGRLSLRTLTVTLPEGRSARDVTVDLNGRALAVGSQQEGAQLTLRFEEPLVVPADGTLQVEIRA